MLWSAVGRRSIAAARVIDVNAARVTEPYDCMGRAIIGHAIEGLEIPQNHVMQAGPVVTDGTASRIYKFRFETAISHLVALI